MKRVVVLGGQEAQKASDSRAGDDVTTVPHAMEVLLALAEPSLPLSV